MNALGLMYLSERAINGDGSNAHDAKVVLEYGTAREFKWILTASALLFT